jgi:hypothetical protein
VTDSDDETSTIEELNPCWGEKTVHQQPGGCTAYVQGDEIEYEVT